MNDELCLRVFAKFIIYMTLLLWQLGHEFKFQTTADQGTNETEPVLPEEEEQALKTVAASLGLKGFSTFYCSDSSLRNYDGRISCNCDFNNSKTCHIDKLSWRNERLKGSLPKEVAKLTYLESLDFSYNEIQGSIPDIWESMSRLNKLDLSNNQFTGPIPKSLGNLKAQVRVQRSGIYAADSIYGRVGSSKGGEAYTGKSAYHQIPGRGNDNKGRRLANQPNPQTGTSGGPNAAHNIPCNADSVYGYCDQSKKMRTRSCPSFNLDLSNNHLEGPIPDTLGSITVDLTNNGGEPLKPDKSCNDFSISLHDNHLNGSIPKTLGQLKFLTTLDLHNNLLTGPIPPSLGDLHLLNSLSLSENQLNGSLPHQLGNLELLKYLFLQSNYLTGNLPESFGRLGNLYKFSISGNYLSGAFPQFIKNWTLIDVLSLYGNSFSGSIPPEIFNLSSLDSLMISDVGTSAFQFPPSANIPFIDTLVLRNCSITGTIPSYIGNMSSLNYLDLSFNKLIDEIPSSLQTLNLTYMSFAENLLSGPIPAWISRAASWTKIDLSYNEFSDANHLFQQPRSFEPRSFKPRNQNLNLFSCCRSCNVSINCAPDMKGVDQLNERYCASDWTPKYHSLYINCGGEETEIDGNHYCEDNSTFPYGVRDPSEDKNWAFSSSGSFLSTDSNSSDYLKNAKCGISVADAPLYSTARLAPVSLKYYGFCLLNGNYSVTLHFAELVYTGDDDTDHSNVKKRIFDVYIQKQLVEQNYHVQSTTRIDPKKVQVIENHTTMVDNGTLEIHLYWAGKGSSGQPPDFNGPLLSAISVAPKFKVGGGKGLTRSHIAMITLSSITFALFLSIFFAWLMGWLEKEELHDINVGDEKTVTLKELIAATGGFSKDKEIGKGGFGTVYKAELHDHQKIVAVKKLSNISKEGIQTLNVGIYNLQTLRHENLVRLLDIHVGKDLCFLVYEYMANKSLADALFEHKIELDWNARFKICVEIAKGLQYLHEHRMKIVHWGIKAANILLDDKLKPKISDLGLASASMENNNEASQSLWLMKTEAGYMAPEYAMIGKKSGYKYDVYSFGVIMLEIVCGRKNVGPGQKNKEELEILVDKVCAADKNGRLPSLVDESLRVYDTKQAMTTLKLAMWCTMSASVRPTMSQVVSVLTCEKSLEEISMHASIDDEKIANEEDSSEALPTDPLLMSK